MLPVTGKVRFDYDASKKSGSFYFLFTMVIDNE